MIQLQNNNDVQFFNTTNLDNELQKNLEENENNDENVPNEQVHHNDVQLEEFFKIKINKIISKIDNIPRKINWTSYIIDWKWDVRRTWKQKFN